MPFVTENNGHEFIDNGRRKFIRSAVIGTIGALGFPGRNVLGESDAARKNLPQIEPGIKLGMSHFSYPSIDDSQLTFLKQLGVEYLEGRISGKPVPADAITGLKSLAEPSGIKIWDIVSSELYNSEAVHFGLPGRDDDIRMFQDFIRELGKAGIHTTTYAWTPGGVFRTGNELTRGCRTSAFDEAEHRKKTLIYDREYSDDELWNNYEYFIKKVLPVAEDAGVRLALHPGDPPVTFNVSRLFRSNAACRRAMDISNRSPYSGFLFCVGTWGEMPGPDGKGEDIIGAISEFGGSGNIFEVHFRNVSSPLPQFHETFVDNGYLDMYKVMKTLREVDYNGIVCPDHVPEFTNETRYGPMGANGTAYTIGYMRALLDMVERDIHTR